MKRVFSILSIISLFVSINGMAQEKIVNTTRAVGVNNTYLIKKNSNPQYNFFIVINERNKLRDKKPVFPQLPTDDPMVFVHRYTRLDKGALHNIIAESFSRSRLKELKDDDIIISLYFNDRGDLLEMTFGLSPESTLTAKEINTVESHLKKNLKLKVLSDKLKGTTFFPFNTIVYFRDLQSIK